MPRSPIRRAVVAASLAVAVLAGSLAGGAPASAYTTRIDLGRGVGTPWISLIGDSTLSGVRWTNSYWPLQRFNYTFDAESCRRTVAPSCRGREGYAPQTALQTMQRLQGNLGHAVVMMTGYNDPGTGFAAAVDAIVAEARRQGLLHVIWLTMRTADVSYVSPTYRSNSYTFRDNNRILLQKAQQYGGYLQIADWASYSAAQPSWVGSDGVHLTPSGAVAVATYIAERSAQVFNGVTITPPPSAVDGWVTLRRGDRGGIVASVQQALIGLGARLVGGADGIFGIHTERAVAAFQVRRGLPITGQVDGATAQRLGVVGGGLTATASPATRMILGESARRTPGGTALDGVDAIGPTTRVAIALSERERNLAARGVADASATSTALATTTTTTPVTTTTTAVTTTTTAVTTTTTAPEPTGWTDLAEGARGEAVAALQRTLVDLAIPVAGGADGVFGAGTREAVVAFQQQRGLPASGVVDEATAIALGLYVPPVPPASGPVAATTTTAPSTTTGFTTTTTAVPPTTTPASTTTTTVAPATTAPALPPDASAPATTAAP